MSSVDSAITVIMTMEVNEAYLNRPEVCLCRLFISLVLNFRQLTSDNISRVVTVLFGPLVWLRRRSEALCPPGGATLSVFRRQSIHLHRSIHLNSIN